MIRLLWLFLIVDMMIGSVEIACYILGANPEMHDTGMRMLLEIAALAIIQAIREGKV
jgi:hypothetical protein